MRKELWIGMIAVLVVDFIVLFGIVDLFTNGSDSITGAVIGFDSKNYEEIFVEESNLTDEMEGTFLITRENISFNPD